MRYLIFFLKRSCVMAFNTIMGKMIYREITVLTYIICYLLYCHGAVLSSHAAHALRHAQVEEGDAAGFINIDCGNEGDTLLPNYQSDAAFIDTGRSFKISPDYIYEGTDPVYKTVRSFPHNTRSCYTLKPSKGRGYNYLIRALFMYGNYDQQNNTPKFDIYIGADFMETMSFDTATNKVFTEFMYKPRMDFIYLCLINTGQGTPFISGLFLRPLNSSIYNFDLGALHTNFRYATGFFVSASAAGFESYKNDTYDRFWSFVPQDNFTAWRPYNTSTDLTKISNDAYKVPPSILRSGVKPLSGKRSLPFSITTKYPTQFCFYWHFAEMEKLGKNETREFNIFTPGYQLGPYKTKYMKAFTVVSPPLTLEPGSSDIKVYINQTRTSTHPPILNALEVFEITNISQATTNEDDVKAILNIKTSYNTMIKGWQGDPCLPVVPWEGLNCNTTNASLHRIISLDLSSKGLTGEILPSLSSLTALNVLNLSYNVLTGSIPEFLAEMSSLQIIDLRGNKLNGSVPFKLANRVSQGTLSLSLDGNPDLCTSDSCSVSEKKKKHNVSVSVIASVAASIILLIIIAVAVFYAYKWKRKTVGITKLKTKNQVFTYSEVVCMTSNFNKILGKGGSGVVYYGCLQDGTPVAVKMLNPSSALAFKLFQTEAQLLVRVHHKNLVSLIGYCEEETCKLLIYEYISNGSLQQRLLEKTVEVLCWKKRLQIAIDIAQGLDYIHSGCKPPIIHRDMKTSNILLDEKMRAKISDFGISREFSAQSHFSTHNLTGEHATQPFTDFAGTYGYIDPEYYGTLRLNEKSDVYSFGVVLLELITGRPALVSSGNNGEPVYLIAIVTPMLEGGDIYNIVDTKLDGDFSVNAAWKALEIAMACVSPIGIQRPSMSQVLTDLKDCLATEIAHEKGRDARKFENELSQEIDDNDIVIADIEAKIGPSAR